MPPSSSTTQAAWVFPQQAKAEAWWAEVHSCGHTAGILLLPPAFQRGTVSCFKESCHLLPKEKSTPPFQGQWLQWQTSPRLQAQHSSHCLAFFTMVPTAEITVVLEPLALVVTVTTPGRVAVVVRMVGWAIVVTGMAESHLLFLFWASVNLIKPSTQGLALH